MIILRKMFKLLRCCLPETQTNKNTFITTLLLLSPFSPLALYFLGIDFGRWFSITIINIFMLLSIFLYSNQPFMKKCSDLLDKNRKIIIAALVVSLLLGPLVKPRGFIWNFGYPPVARSCLNVARLYYGEYDASYTELRKKVRETISSWQQAPAGKTSLR
jgi:hypothetical protein